MQPEIERLTETIEKQLVLLRELAGELHASSSARAGMELDEVYAHLSKQAWICDQLREIGADRQAAGVTPCLPPLESQLNSWIGTIGPELTESLRQVLAELAVTAGQTQHLHRVQRVLADGSRRTLNILTNAVAMFSAIYPWPSGARLLSARDPSELKPRRTA
jgi:hypothetical protein